MAKPNIVYRSYRLNLDNEHHRRVNGVLAGLNTDRCDRQELHVAEEK